MKRFVEVKGIGFPNRGAELLLVSTLQELKRRGMEAVLEPYSPYEYKVAYPLYTKTSIVANGINVLAPLGWMPKFARVRLGLVRPSEVQLALDASGYAYGDPWDPSLAKSRVLQDPSKAPLILLPQSLGPFEKAESKWVAKKLVSRAKAIYAREQIGAQYLQDATGYVARVVPDITFALHVPQSQIRRDVIIIPNSQVLRRRGDSYLNLLVEIACSVIAAGRKVSLLNHEGKDDLEICRSVAQALRVRSLETEVVEPQSGSEAKGIIASSKFVLTSRYHGLISALSQAVPTACIGWSYKYEAALSAFNLPQIDAFSNAAEMFDAIQSERYADMFSTQNYQSKLERQRTEVHNMWDEIFEGISL